MHKEQAEKHIQALLDANLLLAAEAYGAELTGEQSENGNMSTCNPEQVIERAAKIAEITADKQLLESTRSAGDHDWIHDVLSPSTAAVLDIYAHRFYSFWQDGEMVHIHSELADAREWFAQVETIASRVFTTDHMENMLTMACMKNRRKRAPLLWKLMKILVDSETIRLGYLYPDREVAPTMISDLFEKVKEIMLIREQHDSSLQLGEHPEELIPYVWSNIMKNLMNDQLGDSLDNSNALAYLHYSAQETESIAGSDAYQKLKRDFLLFQNGAQRTWPNEVRRMFLDPTKVEALNRYRFGHGLSAVNAALAFRRVSGEHRPFLTPQEEDAVILNGLILTRSGYIRSSGFDDASTRRQFQKDTHLFKTVFNKKRLPASKSIFDRLDEMRPACKSLENKLLQTSQVLRDLLQSQTAELNARKETLKRAEMDVERPRKSFFKRSKPETTTETVAQLRSQVTESEEKLNQVAAIQKVHQEVLDLVGKVAEMLT